MTDTAVPIAAPEDRSFSELKQVTLRADDEIAQVNALLAEGWRLVKIGHTEEKKRARTGFLAAELR
jgi:ribulose bisphosphate carboxylase small subunit